MLIKHAKKNIYVGRKKLTQHYFIRTISLIHTVHTLGIQS